MGTTRAERLAGNEAEFRKANEALPEPTRQQVRFFCECAERECFDFLLLTAGEYRSVREDPMQFVVLPGHEKPDVEEVVGGEGGRFRVVRKHEDVRHVVD